MKIVITGGGTGGHFYPLIAIVEALADSVLEKHLLNPKLYYFSDTPYDQEVLFSHDITFVKIPAGKVRRYVSLRNIVDLFKTLGGTITAFFTLLKLYPDVVVSKGGYASVPTILAAHMLGIPVIVHESDAKPGRANLLASKYATHIDVAFGASASFFPKKTQGRIVQTGTPVRKNIALPLTATDTLEGLEAGIPTVLVLGGSSGSVRINDIVLQALPDLVSFANVIHQTGKGNDEQVRKTANVILSASAYRERYHVFPYLNESTLRKAAGSATVIISRAGATAITELSLWGRPAILIPIPESISHDQRTNAYTYAHTGAAVVIEEANMTPHVLASEARRISTDSALVADMAARGASFSNPQAAHLVAEQILAIALSHEQDKK